MTGVSMNGQGGTAPPLALLGRVIGQIDFQDGTPPVALKTPNARQVVKLSNIPALEDDAGVEASLALLALLMPSATPEQIDGLTFADIAMIFGRIKQAIQAAEGQARAALEALDPNAAGATTRSVPPSPLETASVTSVGASPAPPGGISGA